MFEKLKSKWQLKSNFQLVIVFIVFAITGSLSVYVGKYLRPLLGIDSLTWLYWPARILLILPVYQVLLITIGTIFGQFEFFWRFERKMLNRLSGGLLFREINTQKNDQTQQRGTTEVQ